MAYVTANEIISRLGTSTAAQLTTTSGTTPDSAVIDEGIETAEAQIEGYLRRRISAALTAAEYPRTFAAVKGLVSNMVVAWLYSRRPPVSADVQKLHDRAIEWFKGLANGDIALPDAELNEPDLEYGSADQDAALER